MSDCSRGKGEGKGETVEGRKMAHGKGKWRRGKEKKGRWMERDEWEKRERKSNDRRQWEGRKKGWSATGRKEERGPGGTLCSSSLPGPIPRLLVWILVQHLPLWPLPYSELLSQLAVHHPWVFHPWSLLAAPGHSLCLSLASEIS